MRGYRSAPLAINKVGGTLISVCRCSPVELARRESEVLRLLSQGLTDAQIAERLAITRRTVNWYLTMIYRKCGVPSCRAATLYARELCLL
jgi:DNA-binding CsgD family transcriptional regulator